jgi:TrbL/VirB6 plasmid conjugal transfer protein
MARVTLAAGQAARVAARATAGMTGRATVRLAAGVAACVLVVIASVFAVPAASAAASSASGSVTARTVSAVAPDARVHAGTPALNPGSPGTTSPGTAGTPAVPTGSSAAQTTTQTTTPGAAPQGAICDGLAIVGLGGLCQAGSAAVNSLNDLCSPGPPPPEPAGSGIDAMIRPPQTAAASPQGQLTLYQSYGMAGQSWAPYGLKCSDMTSMIGNNVANAVFDAAKAIDRITITTYQSAAGEGLLGWLKQRVDQLISQIGNAIYFPYLAPVVLLGAAWLAWQGLIRKRATRTLEGTIWMVVACVAAIWLIGRPADFTGVGQKVSDGVNQVLNAAFSRLPVSGGTSCVPVQRGDPQSTGGNFAYTAGSQVVSENADELWTVLVCKPWLAGEFGTMSSNPGDTGNAVNQYGRALLWAQAYAVNEQPTPQLASQKQDVYQGIANKLQADPAVYPLFQGKQWATRLEIAFSGLFAALVAGALVLLIAVTLIVLKLGFLLLLVAGPFFLIIGTHPGFGRVIAIRWFEMLVGVLMKQVAVALTLSVLLYCYALVMGVSDDALPWVFKIMMIALLTVAVFIYRKPFQHLFASVGYDMAGARERAEAYREQARFGFRGQTVRTASSVIPGYAAHRAGRWARRNPDQADQAVFLARNIAAAVATDDGNPAAGGMVGARRGGNGSPDGHGPPGLAPDGNGGPGGGAGSGPGRGQGRPPRGGSRPSGPGLRPDIGGGNGNGRREPPPLDLPRRPRQEPARWQPGPARRAAAPSAPGPVKPAPTPARQASPPARPASGGSPPRSAGVPSVPAVGSVPARHAPSPPRPAQAPPARHVTPQRRQAPSPVAPQERETGRNEREGPPLPFWLRPIKRDR